MSEHLRAQSAAFVRPRSLSGETIRLLTTLVLAASAAGCWTSPPTPVAGPDPSDPGSHTPAVGYRSTLEPYQSRRPVEPLPWREQNERVAPPPKR
jgi:hypothetical protein